MTTHSDTPHEPEGDTPSIAPPAHTRPSRRLVPYLAGHALTTIGEWAVLIALLVYTYDRSGATAVGVASFVAISPYLLLSPVTARIAQRHPPGTVRLTGIAAQAFGFALAGATAFATGPVWLAVLGVMIGYAASTALRPAAAVLLPALVRTSRELTTANVWVGHGDTAALFLGPLLSSGLLAVGNPGTALTGAAVVTAIGLVLSIPSSWNGPPAAIDPTAPTTDRPGLRDVVLGPFADIIRVVRRPGSRGVLLVSMAQFVVVGASDVIWVVIAAEHIDLGGAGAGILSALFGFGSFLCSGVSGRAARRPRVAPLLLLCLGTIAVSSVLLGWVITVATALVLIPVIGLSRGLLDVLARVLLQRSAPPSELASVFGAVETLAGIGGLVGSLVAQVLIAQSGATAALIGIGIIFGLAAVGLAGSLRKADGAADVPVVEMSLLRLLPVFAPLPVWSLEAVARSAREVHAPAGTTIITEGEPGDAFYAIADGRFEVTRAGAPVSSIGRGEGFGEIALLANVPRTATVVATTAGSLLAIDRDPFLVAITGHEPAHDAAWTVIESLSGHTRNPTQ
ncbi:MAG: MFS transporter [Actinobacteria bacterium]|nr:MFS transporter [Actinomycetota bacterium]